MLYLIAKFLSFCMSEYIHCYASLLLFIFLYFCSPLTSFFHRFGNLILPFPATAFLGALSYYFLFFTCTLYLSSGICCMYSAYNVYAVASFFKCTVS